MLHRDISLLNLLLVLCIDGGRPLEVARRLPPEFGSKLPWYRRGLLGDWGYAVPVVSQQLELRPETPDMQSPIIQMTLPVTPRSKPEASQDIVPVQEQDRTVGVLTKDLTDKHDIKLVMGTERPGELNRTCHDNNPLHRTVGYFIVKVTAVH